MESTTRQGASAPYSKTPTRPTRSGLEMLGATHIGADFVVKTPFGETRAEKIPTWLAFGGTALSAVVAAALLRR